MSNRWFLGTCMVNPPHNQIKRYVIAYIFVEDTFSIVGISF